MDDAIKEITSLPTLLTTKEAAAYLRITEQTLYNWRAAGNGPTYYKPQNTVYYYVSDLDAWVKQNER